MDAPVLSVETPDHLLHDAFLSIIPKVETHARIFFRHIKCPEKKADRIAETIALAWSWFRKLARRGKDATCFPCTLASFAVRHVNAGRRLCGQEKGRDVMSSITQQRHHFAVEKFPDYSTLHGSPIEEALQDNTHSAVIDQVCFRIDFPSWISSLSERDHRVVEDLALRHRTTDVARKYGISPGRVSQLREMFRCGWGQFVGDIPRSTKGVAASA